MEEHTPRNSTTLFTNPENTPNNSVIQIPATPNVSRHTTNHLSNALSSTSRRKRKTRVRSSRRKRKLQRKSTSIITPKNDFISTNLDLIERKPSLSNECAICMMPFTGKWIGTPQNCEHNFCFDCLEKWSHIKKSCPIDRKQFNSIALRRDVGGRVIKRFRCRRNTSRAVSTQHLTPYDLFLIQYALGNSRSDVNFSDDFLF